MAEKPVQARVLVTDENKGFGGAERHVLTLASALSKLDILDSVVARKNSWLAEEMATLPFFPVGFRNEVDMLSVYSLYRKIKSAEINVLHCIGHRDLVTAALARQLPGAPPTFLVKAEHSYPDSNLSSLFRWAYGQCHAVTCVSQALKNAVLAEVELDSRVKMPVIPNGMEIPAEYPPNPPLEGRPLKIGVLSPFREGKGHSDFIRAAKRVSSLTDQKIEWSLAGDGELRESLEKQAATLEIEIDFLGHVEDPLEYLSSLDLSVVPSHKETFSLVSLESMVCGRPLVCSDCEAIMEVCGDYPAQVFPVGDVKTLAKAIVEFCDNPSAFLEEAAGARDEARSRFSEEKMGQAYHQLYTELLQR